MPSTPYLDRRPLSPLRQQSSSTHLDRLEQLVSGGLPGDASGIRLALAMARREAASLSPATKTWFMQALQENENFEMIREDGSKVDPLSEHLATVSLKGLLFSLPLLIA